MAQFSRPISIIENNGPWDDGFGGPVLATLLDDANFNLAFNDSAFILSTNHSGTKHLTVGMSSVSDPEVDNNFVLSYGASGGFAGSSYQIRGILLEGTTIIATQDWQVLSGGTVPTLYTFNISAANASLITNFSNLRVKIETQHIGGLQKNGFIYWIRLSCPSLPDEIPADPINLVVTTSSWRTADLSWTPNSDDEDGFRIERKTGSGSFAEVDTVEGGILTYTDNVPIPVPPTTETFCYRVRAFNSTGNSGYSGEQCITPQNDVPAIGQNITSLNDPVSLGYNPIKGDIPTYTPVTT